MGKFFPSAKHLRGAMDLRKSSTTFLAHSRGVKAHLLLRLSIKNLSIGGA